jgi:hypothetical protein
MKYIIQLPKSGRWIVDAPPTGFKSAGLPSKATRFDSKDEATTFMKDRGIFGGVLHTLHIDNKHAIIITDNRGETLDLVGPFASEALAEAWIKANRENLERMELGWESRQLSSGPSAAKGLKELMEGCCDEEEGGQ